MSRITREQVEDGYRRFFGYDWELHLNAWLVAHPLHFAPTPEPCHEAAPAPEPAIRP
jgi:hypothetical protein